MAAMHWEARRRQAMLDRRMARDKQQLLQESPESSLKATESNTTEEQAAGSQCPHCQSSLKRPAPHTAKISNRYSSLQYNQQW